MNKAFWAITAVDAALFVFLLVVTLMQPGPSSGGREMALVFSILLPALVLGLAVLLYLFSKSTGLKVTALVVVAGPGLLLAGIYVRSAYIDYLVQQNASGRGYFSGKAMREMGAAIVRRDVPALQRASAGVDVNTVGDSDMTLLRLAVEEEFASQSATANTSSELPIVKALLALGAKPDPGLDTATKVKDPQILRALLDAGANANLKVSDSPVAFSWIAVMPVENLRLLADHGADLNAKDLSGTPLMLSAAEAENWDAVLFLMQKDVDVRQSDRSGRTLQAFVADKLDSYKASGREVPDQMNCIKTLLSSGVR